MLRLAGIKARMNLFLALCVDLPLKHVQEYQDTFQFPAGSYQR